MSKAPSESFEKAIACCSRPNISSDSRTGPAAASRLMRESSDCGLCGLMAQSMRCISCITASMAAAPAARSSHHSSTRIAVPMMASSRASQPPGSRSGSITAAGRGLLRRSVLDRPKNMDPCFLLMGHGTS
jgi:hypothetical protein